MYHANRAMTNIKLERSAAINTRLIVDGKMLRMTALMHSIVTPPMPRYFCYCNKLITGVMEEGHCQKTAWKIK